MNVGILCHTRKSLMSRQEDIMKFLQYWSRLLRFHFVPEIFSDHLLFIRVNNTKGLLLLPLSALAGYFLFISRLSLLRIKLISRKR